MYPGSTLNVDKAAKVDLRKAAENCVSEPFPGDEGAPSRVFIGPYTYIHPIYMHTCAGRVGIQALRAR